MSSTKYNHKYNGNHYVYSTLLMKWVRYQPWAMFQGDCFWKESNAQVFPKRPTGGRSTLATYVEDAVTFAVHIGNDENIYVQATWV